MDSNKLFAKTPPLKLFFIASLPGAVSMLASALYQTSTASLSGIFSRRRPLRRSTWPCRSSSSTLRWRT